MIGYILNDMIDILPFLPIGIIIGCVAAAAIIIRNYYRGHEINKFHVLGCFLFVVYVVVMVEVALFSREPGSRDSFDWILFSTWGDTAQSRAYVLENVIMFIPFGILLPVIWKTRRSCWRFLLVTLSTSVGIELIQLITKRGYCQIDDVIMNVIGGLVGWMIVKGIVFIQS